MCLAIAGLILIIVLESNCNSKSTVLNESKTTSTFVIESISIIRSDNEYCMYRCANDGYAVVFVDRIGKFAIGDKVSFSKAEEPAEVKTNK